jgi:hypothetical protein
MWRTVYFFAAFLALRAFLPFTDAFAPAPSIAKSSIFLPSLMAAASQRSFNPRPAQVSEGLSGLRYFALGAALLPSKREPLQFNL